MRHIDNETVRNSWLKTMGRLPKYSDGTRVVCDYGVGEIEELESLPHPFVHEYRYGVKLIQPAGDRNFGSIYYFFENDLEAA